MKKKILYVFLFISMISCKTETKKENILLVNNNSNHVINTDSAVVHLQRFYAKYLITVAKEPLENIRQLQKNNITNNFSKRVQEVDYDPIIFAQDANEQSVKTVEVKFVNNNNYEICYSYPYNDEDKKICLSVVLLRENNRYLIDDVKKIYNKIIKQNSNEKPSAENYVSSIFYKNKNDSLIINIQKLDSISKITTRENSAYLFALEKYIQEGRENLGWSIDEFSKIKAYIFYTTYPLRKKYWSDKFNEWYGGKPENYLGDGSIWRDNDYYGLPNLDGYVYDFRHWGEPL